MMCFPSSCNTFSEFGKLRENGMGIGHGGKREMTETSQEIHMAATEPLYLV
jgi:hypothetical protein